MNPSQQELLNQHGPNIQASVARQNLAQTNIIQYEKWRTQELSLAALFLTCGEELSYILV